MPPSGFTCDSRFFNARATTGSLGVRSFSRNAVATRAVMPGPACLLQEPSSSWAAVRYAIPRSTNFDARIVSPLACCAIAHEFE
jgi:hypothetical protein